MFATKYLIVREGRPAEDLKPVFQDSGFVVLRNPYCLARATLPETVITVPDADSATKRICVPSFNPARTAFVTGSGQAVKEYSRALASDEHCNVTDAANRSDQRIIRQGLAGCDR